MSRDEFRKRILEKYPKRDGSLEITKAYEKIKDHVTKGETTYSEFFVSVNNYRLDCEKRGIVGTQFVKQVATFSNKIYKDYSGATSEEEQAWSPF